MASAYSSTPSKLYGLEHPVEAFYFDRAVWAFGSTMDADVEENTRAVKKNREAAIERRIAEWMDDDGKSVGRFASPPVATRGGKKSGEREDR
jgi:hypothetical protein